VKVLSLNCGSSSLRWGLFDGKTKSELDSGRLEEADDSNESWQEIMSVLAGLGPQAIGHRVVHGGERFSESALIDEDVIAAIEASVPLAPSHNPRCLRGIREAQKIFPDLPHVAVFDTAFHQSMPAHAYLYPIPLEFYERDRIRRYGFHGTSHRFVSERAAELLDMSSDQWTGVTCHLGNGCSIAAVRNGRAADTSMGWTPLEGLMMGTRSGDLDPAIVLELASRSELGVDGVLHLLNNESGLLGISGVSSDLRAVENAAESGSTRARLALEIFAHRVRRGIGAALGVLGGADAIVFTGGIGEHSAAMRERIAGSLGGLGVSLDSEANADCTGRESRISLADSKIAVFVIPSQEEWLIARETEAIATLARSEDSSQAP
jgi:acetate kinase